MCCKHQFINMEEANAVCSRCQTHPLAPVPSHELSCPQAGITREREEAVSGPGWILPNKPGLHITHRRVSQPNNALLNKQNTCCQHLKANHFIFSPARPSQISPRDLRVPPQSFRGHFTFQTLGLEARPREDSHKADRALLEPEQDTGHKGVLSSS